MPSTGGSARVAKLVNASDLGSGGAILRGSSPLPGISAPERENGVTRDELIESITHLAFYSGWPDAFTAISVAKEVFEKK